MKNAICRIWILLLFLTAFQDLSAQQRRPIDNEHPLWLVHIDVWYAADPQKIIDLIPDDRRQDKEDFREVMQQSDTDRTIDKEYKF